MDGMYRMGIGAASLLVFLLASSVPWLGVEALDAEDAAVSAVQGAEEAVVQALEAVLDAEGAGANVSDLLKRMSVAAEYLALARMCLRTEDFDGAVERASLCVEALDGLVEDAEVLGDEALNDSSQRSWMAIGVSVVGVVVVGFASCFGWRLLKRRYYRQVLKMRPEVAESES
ncbi:MAG: hypothetical protein JSW53_05005 [Candidatus Bathyarchaeota archaeon]|nr:MAG: hypothetical protein JSW53_05005 [Candidatus Bathyarchaeota archaeon]